MYVICLFKSGEALGSVRDLGELGIGGFPEVKKLPRMIIWERTNMGISGTFPFPRSSVLLRTLGL